MPRRRVATALLAVTALLVAACASDPSPSPSPAPPPTPTPTPLVSPTPTPTPLVTPAAALIPVDRALLVVLPPTVGGILVEPSAEAEASIGSSGELVGLVERFAAAVAVDPQTGDFAFVAVLAVSSSLLDDAAFRSYRDTYDDGACSQSGGVAGNAETEVDGRTVFIGTCGGGLHTYHVRIDDRSLLVSVSAVGAARLGEQLMGDLR